MQLTVADMILQPSPGQAAPAATESTLISVLVEARALAGKGWQRLSYALRCFDRDGADFSAVTRPFVLESSGTGQVEVANVRLVSGGTPNTTCPDYRTQSVTPAPLHADVAIPDTGLLAEGVDEVLVPGEPEADRPRLAGGEIFSNIKAGMPYPLFVELKNTPLRISARSTSSKHRCSQMVPLSGLPCRH